MARGRTPEVRKSGSAHFRCGLCTKQVWREGGHATAQKHHQQFHADVTEPDYQIDVRKAQVYIAKARSFSGQTNTCRWGHTFTDRRSNGGCPVCAEDDKVMRKLREAV